MSFLTIDDISYGYGTGQFVLDHLSFKMEKGKFHSLLGKSGCGKTTLLKLASGLIKPEKGSIRLKGKEVTKPLSESGFVFQSPTLLEWKTVIDNVLLPVSLKRKITYEDREYAEMLLSLMGIERYMASFPGELSGGQQSRVAVARGLIQKPALLFMDEPFAALDAITREDLQEDLLRLCEMQQTTVLFITHDIAEAVFLSDFISVMDKGEFILEQRIDLVKPRNAETRYGQELNEISLKIRRAISGGLR